MARRKPGTGSVHQRPNGSWCGQVSVGRGVGRDRRTIYGDTREDVEVAIAKLVGLPPPERAATVLRKPPVQPGHYREHMQAARAKSTHTEAAWIAKRDAIGCCIYCGTTGRLTRDHVLPPSRGGNDSIGNIVPACLPCNGAKGAETAFEFMRRRLLP